MPAASAGSHHFSVDQRQQPLLVLEAQRQRPARELARARRRRSRRARPRRAKPAGMKTTSAERAQRVVGADPAGLAAREHQLLDDLVAHRQQAQAQPLQHPARGVVARVVEEPHRPLPGRQQHAGRGAEEQVGELLHARVHADQPGALAAQRVAQAREDHVAVQARVHAGDRRQQRGGDREHAEARGRQAAAEDDLLAVGGEEADDRRHEDPLAEADDLARAGRVPARARAAPRQVDVAQRPCARRPPPASRPPATRPSASRPRQRQRHRHRDELRADLQPRELAAAQLALRARELHRLGALQQRAQRERRHHRRQPRIGVDGPGREHAGARRRRAVPAPARAPPRTAARRAAAAPSTRVPRKRGSSPRSLLTTLCQTPRSENITSAKYSVLTAATRPKASGSQQPREHQVARAAAAAATTRCCPPASRRRGASAPSAAPRCGGSPAAAMRAAAGLRPQAAVSPRPRRAAACRPRCRATPRRAARSGSPKSAASSTRPRQRAFHWRSLCQPRSIACSPAAPQAPWCLR